MVINHLVNGMILQVTNQPTHWPTHPTYPTKPTKPTIRPAQAGDVVNYSDFLDSINKGEVEMVRVQNDMLSAQYTTKDQFFSPQKSSHTLDGSEIRLTSWGYIVVFPIIIHGFIHPWWCRISSISKRKTTKPLIFWPRCFQEAFGTLELW